MQLDISHVLKSPNEELSFSFEEAVDGVADPAAGLELVGPALFSGQVRATGRAGRMTLKGSLKAPLKLTCTRCGEPFERLLEIPVDLLLGPEPEGEEWVPETDTEKAVDYPIAGSYLDLEPVVRDAILLAVPMQVLCRPDCRGCCPYCGAQLNRTSCDCATKAGIEQSPFGKLRDLL